MRKNIVRIMILGVLILVCMWQTITLWLGDVSSHNFFGNGQENSYEQSYVFPKQIWAIKNGSAYVIEDDNSEESRRYKLITELINELKRENIQISSEIKVSYEQLLKTQGIDYQYGIPLSLSEITGKSYTENKKEINVKVKDIFVDVSASNSYKAYVYLVDEDGQVQYMITLNNKLPIQVGTLARFTEESQSGQVEKYMNYQPSLLSIIDSEYFKGNVFYPINNNIQTSIAYESIDFRPVIIEGDEQHLEGLVNHLFTNSLYVQKNVSDKNCIVYYDNLNLSVKYERVGTLEFLKSVNDVSEKMTAAQRMNKIMTFIMETDAVPSELKKGLYLCDIVNNGEENGVTYYFNYAYKNYDVIMSEEIKEKLGIHAYLELTIKSGEIISGKWLMMEPQITASSDLEIPSISCNEVTTQIYGDSIPKREEKLEALECAYIFDSVQEALKFKWVAVKHQHALSYDEKFGINEI